MIHGGAGFQPFETGPGPVPRLRAWVPSSRWISLCKDVSLVSRMGVSGNATSSFRSSAKVGVDRSAAPHWMCWTNQANLKAVGWASGHGFVNEKGVRQQHGANDAGKGHVAREDVRPQLWWGDVLGH
jgi:hypothetical protein